MNVLARLPPAILAEHVLSKLSKRDVLAMAASCAAALRLVEQFGHVLTLWSRVRIPGGGSAHRKRKAGEPFPVHIVSYMSLLHKRAPFIHSLQIVSFRLCHQDVLLASHCSMLKELDLRSLQAMELDAVTLETVSQQCLNLVSLGIHPSCFIRGTKTLFPRLQKLVLCGGSTADIQSYFTFPLPQLLELQLIDFDLRHCVLIGFCTNLRSLSLVRCWRHGEWDDYGGWDEGDSHPFHPQDPILAPVLHNLTSLTLCASETAFCTDAVIRSIFDRNEWPNLQSLTADDTVVVHKGCQVQKRYKAGEYACTSCAIGHAHPSAIDYNKYYKDQTTVLRYERCDKCRAKDAKALRSLTILWWP